MAQAQLDEQKRVLKLFEELKKEVTNGEGLAWLFQQKTYTDGNKEPTTATPPIRTTSSELRLVFDSIEENLKQSNKNLNNNQINFCKLVLGKTLLLLDRHVKSHRWKLEKVQFIWQVECGKTNKFHIHCCLGYFDPEEDKKDTQKSLGWLLKKLNKELASIYSEHHCSLQGITDSKSKEENLQVWLKDGILKPYKYFNKQTKESYNKPINLEEYVIIYLFSKAQITKEIKDGYFAAGNGGIIDTLTNQERYKIRKLYLDEQSNSIMDEWQDWDNSQEPPKVTVETISNVTFVDSAEQKTGSKLIWDSCSSKVTANQKKEEVMKQPSKKMCSAKDTLEIMFNLGCFTPEDMIIKMGDKYLELSLETNGNQKIQTLLHMNQVKTATVLNAFECIMKFNEDENDEPLKQIISDMGLNEKILKKVLGTILTKQGGKRNCLWLYGPGGTGKTLLASLICKAVVNFGMVTTSNPNFPWTDCGNRNIIWGEELGNLSTFVEDFKAITGGAEVKVDTKNKQPQTIKGSMIVTSNSNLTKITIGCVETSIHTEPLKQRLVKIVCSSHINPTFKVTPGMLRKWLSSWDGKAIPLNHDMHELYTSK
ncbi:putative nonstructural protein [sabeidhel virus 1]|uniref:Initiator protein NS1 n=1 Tax=sabeidhel virus 1 TaxID=2992925 RepID=A0A9E7VB57_9VIRU|nr:putative nonstructural protein [sabeidhel virus 1]